MNLRERTLEIALAEVGVREQGGANRGKRVEQFLREARIAPGEPWCAAFVNWCARFAADEMGVISPLESVPLQGYVKSYADHKDPAFARVSIGDARPGDLYLQWHPSKKRHAHIGLFVKRLGDDVIMTVEGNTNDAGSREGDGVYRRQRALQPKDLLIRWTRVVKPRP